MMITKMMTKTVCYTFHRYTSPVYSKEQTFHSHLHIENRKNQKQCHSVLLQSFPTVSYSQKYSKVEIPIKIEPQSLPFYVDTVSCSKTYLKNNACILSKPVL